MAHYSDIPAQPSDAKPREIFIQGITANGKAFRPSDWAERLCGVLSQFRPEDEDPTHAHIGYSPFVRPTNVHGVKCVIVDARLRDIEPMAWEFALSFARDNGLLHGDACEVPLPTHTQILGR
jgi:hypothetical protein